LIATGIPGAAGRSSSASAQARALRRHNSLSKHGRMVRLEMMHRDVLETFRRSNAFACAIQSELRERNIEVQYVGALVAVATFFVDTGRASARADCYGEKPGGRLHTRQLPACDGVACIERIGALRTSRSVFRSTPPLRQWSRAVSVLPRKSSATRAHHRTTRLQPQCGGIIGDYTYLAGRKFTSEGRNGLVRVRRVLLQLLPALSGRHVGWSLSMCSEDLTIIEDERILKYRFGAASCE